MCSIGLIVAAPYRASVVDRERIEQAKAEATQVVGRWRDSLLDRFKSTKLTKEKWAALAGISATTVSRNMDAKHASTAKLENLHLMARALGEPSVLDFLRSQANGIQPQPTLALPSADELTDILRGLLLATEELSSDLDERARMLAKSLPDRLQGRQPPLDPRADDTANSVVRRPRAGAGNQPSTERG